MSHRAWSSDPAPGWWWRSLLWTAAGMLGAPVALSALISLTLLVTARPDLWSAPGQVIGGFIVMVYFTGAAGIALGIAYLPVLLAWARWGRQLGRWERSRGHLCVALAGLAAPAAIAVLVVYWRMEPPSGARGMELARIVGVVFAGTWLGLTLPRLMVPTLRAAAFADDRTAT